MAQPDRSDQHTSRTVLPTERQLDPFPGYEQMRTTAPVRYNERCECWNVFGYNDVQRVLLSITEMTSQHRRGELAANHLLTLSGCQLSYHYLQPGLPSHNDTSLISGISSLSERH
jgi:cytochrome P450